MKEIILCHLHSFIVHKIFASQKWKRSICVTQPDVFCGFIGRSARLTRCNYARWEGTLLKDAMRRSVQASSGLNVC